SGRTPISSLLACISTKRRTAVRYSSGIQSVASILPPSVTCASKWANRSSWGRSSFHGRSLRSITGRTGSSASGSVMGRLRASVGFVREHAERQVDDVVGDAIGGQSTVGLVPGGNPVEGREQDGRGDR